MPEEIELNLTEDTTGIKNPDDVHGYCMECGSEQPDNYMMKSPFDIPPCKYCGGVTYVGYAERREQDRARLNQQRNIGHDPDIKHKG